MRKNVLLTVLATGLLVLAPDAALAQEKLRTIDALPDASRIYPHRRKIEFVDTTPDVSFHPKPVNSPNTLIIHMPAAQAPQGQTFVVAAPASGPASGQVRPIDGGFVVDLSKPPVASFGTNIPTGLQAPRQDLPNGRFTIGRKSLSGSYTPAPLLPLARAVNTSAPVKATAPRTLEYAPVRVGVGSGSKVTTDVSGKLKSNPLERGSLIGKRAN